MRPTRLPTLPYRNGSRDALTLLEVVIASFLVGTFLSLIVAAAGSYQKLHRLNEHKHHELMRVQAFLSDWSQVEFSDEKLAALAVRHRLRVLSNAREKALLSSNELGMMVSPEAKRIPGVLDAELVSIDFWRGDPLLSTWEVTSIEIFRRPHGGQYDERKE